MALLFVRSRTGRNYRRAGFTWPTDWTAIHDKDLGPKAKKEIEADPHLQVRTDRPATFEGKTPLPHDESRELTPIEEPKAKKPEAPPKPGPARNDTPPASTQSSAPSTPPSSEPPKS